ncbi:ras-related protein Rab-38-like [Panonychus citri]|uniref:ras-related protein Rab-38-like n=1 Tax=Panonychus citri TaxID=50023 RepID=UPI00230708B6|nr:ras-related protein Rab-38-like [Panonychus citri]XP_053212125.1 ras-related protein Rab-38-like [Panonychus citri]
MPIHRLPTPKKPLESTNEQSIVYQEKPREQKIFKILVIGEVSVGKTSIIKRYVHNLFSQQYRATIGVDFALKKIVWNDDIEIIVQLWDIAGQDRFASLTRVYYKGASGSFVITDSTNPDSFDSAIKWKKDFDSKVTLEDGQPVPSLLLVNKCELDRTGIANDKSKLDCFSKENGFSNWFYVSAAENIGVKEATKLLIKEIMGTLDNHNRTNQLEINGNTPTIVNQSSTIESKQVILTNNEQVISKSDQLKKKNSCEC